MLVFVSLCWSSCLCVGLLCDCVTAKAIPGLLTFSHFCRRRYSWRLTIIRTKATSVTTIEIEKPYSVKLKLPNCQIALFSLPIAIHCQIAFAKFLYCLYCLELNLPIMERGFPALCVSFCAAIVPTIIHLSASLLSIAQLEKQQIKDMRLSDLLLSLFLFNNHERKVDFKKGRFWCFRGLTKLSFPMVISHYLGFFLRLIWNTMAQKHKTLPLLL